MNRPRNRQPRGGGGGRRGHPGSARGSPATPQQSAGTVPRASAVFPGVTVAIVLKEDQPTGNETRGVVADVLTRGDHPRGVKVRLRDGRVGRVQRLVDSGAGGGGAGASEAAAGAAAGTGASTSRAVFSNRYTDVRNDDFLEGPPPRSLADFMPDFDEPPARPAAESQPTAKCPFCEDFEGDEAAVTYHIDEKHLT